VNSLVQTQSLNISQNSDHLSISYKPFFFRKLVPKLISKKANDILEIIYIYFVVVVVVDVHLMAGKDPLHPVRIRGDPIRGWLPRITPTCPFLFIFFFTFLPHQKSLFPSFRHGWQLSWFYDTRFLLLNNNFVIAKDWF